MASTNQSNARTTKSSAHNKATANNSLGNSRAHGSKMQTKRNVPEWDTDFDGSWEMGRDLIREFVMKQNNRNRSISESEAGNFVSLATDSGANQIDVTNEEAAKILGNEGAQNLIENDEVETNLMKVAAAATSALFSKNNFDMAGGMNVYSNALNVPDSGTFSAMSVAMDSALLTLINDNTNIHSEGYSTPDTLSSWNEMAPRRLYEREVSNESINCAGLSKGGTNDIETNSDCVDSGCDENIYLAAFEAKFDQNVEALWNDCKSDEAVTTVSNAEVQPLNSFWFDYYRNNGGSADGQSAHGSSLSELNNQSASLFMQKLNLKNPFATAQPNSLNSNASSVGGMGLTGPSIWSDNPSNNEDDVSFYANAKLWEKKYPKQVIQKLNVSLFVSFYMYFCLF